MVHYNIALFCCIILPFTAPINCSVAHNVIKTNSVKIVMSGVDVFLLATSLNGHDVIDDPFFRRITDTLTRAPAHERLVQLLANVTHTVRTNGGAFKKVLLSLAVCGKQQLSTDLYQQYCSM